MIYWQNVDKNDHNELDAWCYVRMGLVIKNREKCLIGVYKNVIQKL